MIQRHEFKIWSLFSVSYLSNRSRLVQTGPVWWPCSDVWRSSSLNSLWSTDAAQATSPGWGSAIYNLIGRLVGWLIGCFVDWLVASSSQILGPVEGGRWGMFCGAAELSHVLVPPSVSSPAMHQARNSETSSTHELRYRTTGTEPQVENHTFKQSWSLCVADVLSILERLGSDRPLLKESVLIGCSEQNRAQFCLDVGKNSLLWW